MGRIVFAIFFSPAARFARYLFVGRALVFTTAELVKPARDVSYRSVALMDLIAWAGYSYLIIPMAAFLTLIFPSYHLHLYPAKVLAMPLSVRIVLAYLLGDFSNYWLHRLMHTHYLWSVHKWHHSPTHMYWLSGVRGSLPQQFLYNIPNALLIPFYMYGASPLVGLFAVGVFASVFNDWMHMNVTWRSRWLEYVIVTPRYHHIHHSDNPEHNGNMGALFTFWDRIFGTYIDPETVHEELHFGIGKKENPVRLVLGV